MGPTSTPKFNRWWKDLWRLVTISKTKLLLTFKLILLINRKWLANLGETDCQWFFGPLSEISWFSRNRLEHPVYTHNMSISCVLLCCSILHPLSQEINGIEIGKKKKSDSIIEFSVNPWHPVYLPYE